MRKSKNIALGRANCQKLLHLSLLVTGLVVTRQYFLDYFSGKTGYSVSQQYLTALDIPTLTICLQTTDEYFLDEKWGMYGDYFYTNITYYGFTRRATSTLKMKRSIINPLGFHTHLSELQQSLKMEKELRETSKKSRCFKVSSGWSGNDLHEFL